MRRLALGASVLFASVTSGGLARATVSLTSVTALTSPVYVTHAKDQRLFMVELGGRIRIFDRGTGTLLPSPFLDIASKVSIGGERGLLSMAFHPDYATTGFFYVYYTNTSGDIVIERYQVSSDANVANASSAVQLLLIDKPSFTNHNGGQLQINPVDGYLYIGTGDGGGAGDPNGFAQNLSSHLGKLLRVDVRQNLSTAPYYGIPAGNPFAGPEDPRPDEILAYGLRNPWRFSFDRITGDLYIADVGQSSWEEIDRVSHTEPIAGLNFGWNVREGAHCYNAATCNATGMPDPIYEYSHTSGACSVTGGYVYRGTLVPELLGRYVFGDWCTGVVSTLQETSPGVWQAQPLLAAGGSITSFGEDSSGGLYVIAGNTIYRFDSDATSVPALPWYVTALLGLTLFGLGLHAARRTPATHETAWT